MLDQVLKYGYVGHTDSILFENIRDAQTKLLNKNYDDMKRLYPQIRCISVDGNSFPITKEMKKSRVNVIVKRGIIIGIYGFY